MRDRYEIHDPTMFANPGSALRSAGHHNPRNLPCPTCREPDRLGRARRLEARPDRRGGGGRNLLADDRREERGKAVGASAQRQGAGQLQRTGESRLDGGEPGGALGHVRLGLDDPSNHALRPRENP